MKLSLAVALGLVHLALVSFGAAEIGFGGAGFLVRLLRGYGTLSGASANYSFFAPRVGSPLRARFLLTDAQGRTEEEGTDTGDREQSLRFGNIVDAFREKIEIPEVRRSVAASWSAHVLSKHPTAQQVRFVLDEYHLPTMTEFAQGQRPSWHEDYSATLVRRRKP